MKHHRIEECFPLSYQPLPPELSRALTIDSKGNVLFTVKNKVYVFNTSLKRKGIYIKNVHDNQGCPYISVNNEEEYTVTFNLFQFSVVPPNLYLKSVYCFS